MKVIDLAATMRFAPAADEQAARAHLDDLTKPAGSLGRLEDLAVRIAAIYGDPPPALARRCILAFAADHGVAAEGVSAYPQEVTTQMCAVVGAGRAGVNALARACGATVHLIDVGVNSANSAPGVENRRVRNGTRNLAREAALLPAEVEQALAVGYDAIASRAHAYDIFAVGELGIANSTAAAAVTAALLELRAERVCGRGTGIDDDALQRKVASISAALSRLGSRPVARAILAEAGGLELCAIAGAAIACVAHRRALVMDGFIATAGVLAARALCPAVSEIVFASHLSPEPGHALQLAALGQVPLFDLQLRLGEGTGAALALPIIDAAARLLSEMATFSDAGVSREPVAVVP